MGNDRSDVNRAPAAALAKPRGIVECVFIFEWLFHLSEQLRSDHGVYSGRHRLFLLCVAVLAQKPTGATSQITMLTRQRSAHCRRHCRARPPRRQVYRTEEAFRLPRRRTSRRLRALQKTFITYTKRFRSKPGEDNH